MSEVVKPPAYVWAYPAAVDSVHDGDTVILHVLIHPNEGGELHEVHIRVEGVNAPELNTAEGKAAKAYAETILPPGTQVSLISRKRDKYGRWLGRIVLPDGSDFGELMLANGLRGGVPRLMAVLRFRRGKGWSGWYSAGRDPWQKAQAWARRHGTVELRVRVGLIEADEW